MVQYHEGMTVLCWDFKTTLINISMVTVDQFTMCTHTD